MRFGLVVAIGVLAGSAQAQFTQSGLKLTGTGGLHSNQGFSCAISADGNTAIVGGVGDSPVPEVER